MNQAFWTDERIAGSIFVASFLILLLAVIILIASGAGSVFSSVIQDSLDQMAPYAPTFRLLNLLWTVDWIVQLLGFALLTSLLLHTGKGYPAVPAFMAVFVASILGVLHGTFHMSIETWAAEEIARTGMIPEIYEPLETWISDSFRVGYLVHLVGMAGFGWEILRTRLLAPGVGWAVIGWSALWFIGGLAGIGAPGILFIMPIVIGVALLLR